MKTVKIFVILAILLASFSVRAVCPTQKTIVMYLNGVDVKESDAVKSKRRLQEEVLKESGALSDCIDFNYVYNTNEFIFLDWMESYFQKAGEASDWWRSYMRLDTRNAVLVALFNGTTDFLADTMQATANAGQWVLGDQKAEHLARFRTEINTNGRQLILVPHSQGNLYANEE